MKVIELDVLHTIDELGAIICRKNDKYYFWNEDIFTPFSLSGKLTVKQYGQYLFVMEGKEKGCIYDTESNAIADDLKIISFDNDGFVAYKWIVDGVEKYCLCSLREGIFKSFKDMGVKHLGNDSSHEVYLVDSGYKKSLYDKTNLIFDVENDVDDLDNYLIAFKKNGKRCFYGFTSVEERNEEYDHINTYGEEFVICQKEGYAYCFYNSDGKWEKVLSVECDGLVPASFIPASQLAASHGTLNEEMYRRTNGWTLSLREFISEKNGKCGIIQYRVNSESLNDFYLEDGETEPKCFTVVDYKYPMIGYMKCQEKNKYDDYLLIDPNNFTCDMHGLFSWKINNDSHLFDTKYYRIRQLAGNYYLLVDSLDKKIVDVSTMKTVAYDVDIYWIFNELHQLSFKTNDGKKGIVSPHFAIGYLDIYDYHRIGNMSYTIFGREENDGKSTGLLVNGKLFVPMKKNQNIVYPYESSVFFVCDETGIHVYVNYEEYCLLPRNSKINYPSQSDEIRHFNFYDTFSGKTKETFVINGEYYEYDENVFKRCNLSYRMYEFENGTIVASAAMRELSQFECAFFDYLCDKDSPLYDQTKGKIEDVLAGMNKKLYEKDLGFQKKYGHWDFRDKK